MKILHWDEMFHPTFGYQINILPKYQAKKGHEVIIMTSSKIDKHPAFNTFAKEVDIEKEDKNYSEKYGVKIIRLPIYGVVSGRVIYKPGFLKKIKNLKPDIIMCHTNDTLSSIQIARNHKYLNTPIVFDNHMLDMASKNPFNKYFKKFFKKNITPLIVQQNWKVIRTQDDSYVNKSLGIPSYLTPFISFGSDTSMFYPSLENRKKFRKENNISDNDFVVLYTGKLNESKGGKFLAKSFEKKFNTNKNITLVVVGNTVDEYELEVRNILGNSENKVIFFPTQRYVDLPKFYQMADISIFPKQASLSFYDAQACGLPVISEDNNVNVGRLQYDNGLNFKQDDINDFRKKILELATMNSTDFDNMRNNAYEFIKERYDYEEISNQYDKVLIEEYHRFKKHITK